MSVTCRANVSRLRPDRPRSGVTRLGQLFWSLDEQPLWSIRTRTDGWPGGDLSVPHRGMRPALYLEDHLNKRRAVHLRTPGSWKQATMEESLSHHLDPLAVTILTQELWRTLWLAGGHLLHLSEALMEDRNVGEFTHALNALAKSSCLETGVHG